MPCAAGVRCKLPGQTPGPPFYTIDKCRKCRGYLHGICGEKDPIEDDDCKRMWERRSILCILRPITTKKGVTFVVRVWSGPVYIVLLKTCF